MWLNTTSAAIRLATSPAAAPPMPSATMNSAAGPDVVLAHVGYRLATLRVRSATRKVSSLWSRVFPTSVLPKTEMWMLPWAMRFLSSPAAA